MLLNQTFDADGRSVPINGTLDKAFASVADAFMENFRVEDEVGSSVAVVVDGRPVVELWGGWKDQARSSEWQRDTIACMMSVSKGITSLCFAMMVDRGLVDVDAPVARYWPEFAQGGKADMPVRYILDHRSGLPIIRDPLWPGAIYDHAAMANALAAQVPLWEPGTVAAYQINILGTMLGEIMERVDGRSLGQFLQEEVAGPLGADYRFGLHTDADLLRCAEVMPNIEAKLFAAREGPKEDLRAQAFVQNPKGSWKDMLNSPEWRRAEIGSANGHGTALGVARIYGAFVNSDGQGNTPFLKRDTLEQMITEQHHEIEIMQDRHYHQALGVLLNTPEHVYMGPNPRAFGHHGIGGSIGFGDPDARVGFSYCCNKFHPVGDNGPRARRLIDAVYACLD